MDIKKTTITPQMAAVMLEKNTSNRPIQKRTVETLARTIKSGMWKFNGDPIRIARSGRLLDGQHRLTACVESGLPIESVVITGLSEDVFSLIDNGRRRSAKDVLSMAGFGYLSKDMCSACAAYRIYMGETMRVVQTTTNQEMLEEITGRLSFIATATEFMATTWSSKKSFMRRAALVAAAAVIHEHGNYDWDDMRPFFERVADGEMLERDDPRYALREYELGMRRYSHDSAGRHIHMRVVVHAWNAYVAGEKMKLLRAPNSNIMPTPKKGA